MVHDLAEQFQSQIGQCQLHLAIVILSQLTLDQALSNHAINQFRQRWRVHENDVCEFRHRVPLVGLQTLQDPPCFDLNTQHL